MDSHFNYLFNNKYNLHYQFDNRGSAWFYADEIARYLGYDRARNMVRMIPGSYVVLNINNPIIPEYGLDMSQTLSETLSSLSELSSNQEHRSQFTIIHESGVYLIALLIMFIRTWLNLNSSIITPICLIFEISKSIFCFFFSA